MGDWREAAPHGNPGVGQEAEGEESSGEGIRAAPENWGSSPFPPQWHRVSPYSLARSSLTW